jgi:hypothetical protein
VTSKRARVLAGQMGARAGDALRTTGRPTRNPFRDGGRLAELAAAWRRAYFTAARPGRRPDTPRG